MRPVQVGAKSEIMAPELRLADVPPLTALGRYLFRDATRLDVKTGAVTLSLDFKQSDFGVDIVWNARTKSLAARATQLVGAHFASVALELTPAVARALLRAIDRAGKPNQDVRDIAVALSRLAVERSR